MATFFLFPIQVAALGNTYIGYGLMDWVYNSYSALFFAASHRHSPRLSTVIACVNDTLQRLSVGMFCSKY